MKSESFIELPSGLIVSESTAEMYYRQQQRPKAIDLFCGCGGFSLGIIAAGFDVVAAVDSWPVAAITYMYNLGAYPCQFHFISDADEIAFEKEVMRNARHRNKGKDVWTWDFVSGGARRRDGAQVESSQWWPHPDYPGVGHFFLGDVRKLSGLDLLEPLGLEVGELDLLVGSPPCQGFSKVNSKRSCMDPRNSLVFDFARLVCEIQPRSMLMENVPEMINMVTPEGIPVVDQFCRILEDGGFGGVDAFKRALAAQTGAVGLLRGSKKVRREEEPEDQPEDQMDLFQPAVR